MAQQPLGLLDCVFGEAALAAPAHLHPREPTLAHLVNVVRHVVQQQNAALVLNAVCLPQRFQRLGLGCAVLLGGLDVRLRVEVEAVPDVLGAEAEGVPVGRRVPARPRGDDAQPEAPVAAPADELFGALDITSLRVSENSLREGIVIDQMMDFVPGFKKSQDVRGDSALTVANPIYLQAEG